MASDLIVPQAEVTPQRLSSGGSVDNSYFVSRPVMLDVNGVVYNTTEIVKCNRTRVGNELPNHRQRILRKESATTALTGLMESAEFVTGIQSIREKSGFKRYTTSTGCGFGLSHAIPMVVGSGNTAKAQATAIGRFNEQVSQLNSPLSGQVFLGEAKKTIQMLRSPFKAGYNLLKDFLKFKQRRTASNVAHTISSLWLETRFGLLPLVSDIDALLGILVKQAQTADVRTYRCYGMGEASTTTARSGSDIAGIQLHGTITRTTKVEHIIRFGHERVALDATGVKYQALRNSFLDIKQLLSTAWELVPFSFLVDYFLNIGQIIQSATSGQQGVIWTSASTIVSNTCTISADTYVIGSQYDLLSFSPASITRTSRSVVRSGGPVGIPPLVFSLPGSNIQLLNIAALLTGLVSKRG